MTPGANDRQAAARVLAPIPRLSLNVQQACAALGVSWDVWREHIEPEIKLVRIGKRKLVPVAELERWLAANADTALSVK